MSEWLDARLIRVYLGESDRVADGFGGRSLHEEIVQRARERGLRGATVLRGVEGYGAHAKIHTTRVLALSDDLPVVVEIVDERAAVEAFLPELEEMLEEGALTVEKVRLKTFGRDD